MERTSGQNNGRVRKRISNACTRCRQQKIKCSGTVPCAQCSRRAVRCIFDSSHQKVFVSQKYLAQLERQAAVSRGHSEHIETSEELQDDDNEVANLDPQLANVATPRRTISASVLDVEDVSESESPHPNDSGATPDIAIRNPLDPGNPDSFAVSIANQHYHLGVSSNWSFGRRVFAMVHDKMNEHPLSSADLFFEGCTYDLGLGGQWDSTEIDPLSLPTADFALFLINTVKFRCGGLFHMFDEATFMQHFEDFYKHPETRDSTNRLWLVHFLIIMAFGKAFTVHVNKGARPPGAELFIQAMRLLPDVTYLRRDSLQAMEALSCAALYLQCLDHRSAAYNIIGQAMRQALEQGLHTDMRTLHLSDSVIERCRKIWWTVFVLDRQMTSLMGTPLGVSDDDISTPLPSFGGSSEKLLALSLHVKLAKAQAVILRTVYGKSGRKSERFISSMKEALQILAEANDQRNDSFPIDLKNPTRAISRVAAYLHLFHHQALILATRPLLFSFLQKRLESSRTTRVSSSHGARSLLRVCVSSSIQCLNILEVLQSQNLLDTFIPFDLEATFTSALVLAIAAAVDPSLIREKLTRIDVAGDILDEMMAHGNLIACHHKRELEQLNNNLNMLREMEEKNPAADTQMQLTMTGATTNLSDEASTHASSSFDGIDNLFREWNSEDGLTGEDLLAVADSFAFEQLDWPTLTNFDPSMEIY